MLISEQKLQPVCGGWALLENEIKYGGIWEFDHSNLTKHDIQTNQFSLVPGWVPIPYTSLIIGNT
jgi:hypothetical protein